MQIQPRQPQESAPAENTEQRRAGSRAWPGKLGILLMVVSTLGAVAAQGEELRVLKTGLGSGTVTSSVAGINCGTDCNHLYSSFQSVTLTVAAGPGSKFVGWSGDCTGGATDFTCELSMVEFRSVRAEFQLSPGIPPLTEFTPEAIAQYLEDNELVVNTPARFVKALPAEFKRNWILMTRSESLQTGTARYPRILMPSADARAVFTIGTAESSSYPASHPNAIEYMQWDPDERSFRFHEIVLGGIPAMGNVEPRDHGISVDEMRCSMCHSTLNVLNTSSYPGTTGIPAGTVKVKNKPNWDTYDSWGGMTPFNRDRIYQGSIEAAALRRLLNPWTWNFDPSMRAVIEQLELQPPDVEPVDVITRASGGPLDGSLIFSFDLEDDDGGDGDGGGGGGGDGGGGGGGGGGGSGDDDDGDDDDDDGVAVEEAPMGTEEAVMSNYLFPGTESDSTLVVRGGEFVTLRHTNFLDDNGGGRGVRFFDMLGTFAGAPNQLRIADELANHRFATGSVPIEIRPTVLAIAKGCLSVDFESEDGLVVAGSGTTPLTVPQDFFVERNGMMSVRELFADTLARARRVPQRKADIQKLTLDRRLDEYADFTAVPAGLISEFGVHTHPSQGTSVDPERIRQEVFRRPVGESFLEQPDVTEMGGLFVDREIYGFNTEPMTLYRFFLEPLGVAVDKWSMGVRGRSRTYSFADVFDGYQRTFRTVLAESLGNQPVEGLESPYECSDLITAMNNTLSLATLPAADALPTFTDVQRVFNKSCIECHGGLDYPPYSNYGGGLNLSENETPAAGETRFTRSYEHAVYYASRSADNLYDRITDTSEDCPSGMMPCGGPALSATDIDTIRRWIGGSYPSTAGDPHIRTIDGIDYDFQAAGEFVLLRGEGVELQTRQTAVPSALPLGPDDHTGLTACVSINTAVAARMGRHRITYQPGLDGVADPKSLELRIDGELIPNQIAELNLPLGGRILRDGPGGALRMEYGGTEVLVTPMWWSHHRVWFMNIDVQRARATRGLMGAVAPGDWLPARPDGSRLGPRPADLNDRYLQLYEDFGKVWRVTDDDSLFDYAPGTDTRWFTLEEWPLGQSPEYCKIAQPVLGTPETDPQPPMSEQEAAELCNGVKDPERRKHCTMDVSVTGEAAFAHAYLQAQVRSLNEPPARPQLVSPASFGTYAGRLELEWKPGEETQEDIVYRLCVWSNEELFSYDQCVRVYDTTSIWPDLFQQQGFKAVTSRSKGLDPQSGDAYFWKVLAEDELGAVSASETWRFEVE